MVNCRTALGQCAVEIPLYTVSLPSGSGQRNSFRCPLPQGSDAVNPRRSTAHCCKAVGQCTEGVPLPIGRLLLSDRWGGEGSREGGRGRAGHREMRGPTGREGVVGWPVRTPPLPVLANTCGWCPCRVEPSHACGLCPMQGGTLQERGGGPHNPPGMGGVARLVSGSRPRRPCVAWPSGNRPPLGQDSLSPQPVGSGRFWDLPSPTGPP